MIIFDVINDDDHNDEITLYSHMGCY